MEDGKAEGQKSGSLKGETKDIGFGKSTGNSNARFINKDGSINVLRKGLPFLRPYDFYHYLITIQWRTFLLLVSTSFFLLNFFFALLYTYLESVVLSGIVNDNSAQEFWESFFFSVQTVTTVGYGAVSPVSLVAQVLSSVESFIGLLGIALITGLLYGRFSRPEAKIKYSKNALIAPFQDGKALMFKMANQRSSKLIEAEVKVVMSYDKDGTRVFQNLGLQLQRINFFALSWTIVHPINEESPLHGFKEGSLGACNAEIVILVKAFDDTFSQTVYSRMSYKCEEFVWNAKFTSSIQEEDGQMTIDLAALDNYNLVQDL